jgi:3-deoxy-D-manno-octulosonic-acid transferase
MNPFLYTLGIRLFRFGMGIASLFIPKATKWVAGRRRWKKRYSTKFEKKGKVFWMHVASLGEFEQGRPVLERFRAQHPDWQIVLTFFSPSGYEVRKTYPLADFVCYLPLDTPQNARRFLDIFQPDLVVFVKYEFWYHFLHEVKKRAIPCYLISALFRPDQAFFKKNNALWLRILHCFEFIFVQNDASKQLLEQVGIHKVQTTGDTRIDRVLYLAENAVENEVVHHFTQEADRILIVGSSWPADEDLLFSVLHQEAFLSYKIIIAPHEPNEPHVKRLVRKCRGEAIRYSQYTEEHAARFLIIDNIGMLNTLYRYGTIAYIGGGFGKGIHNILEPAAYGLPVLFGPNFQKFDEARNLVEVGGAYAVQDVDACEETLIALENEENYQRAVSAINEYLLANKGSSKQITAYISATFDSI